MCLIFFFLTTFLTFSRLVFFGLQPSARPFVGSSSKVVGITIDKERIFCYAVAAAFFLHNPRGVSLIAKSSKN